MKGGLFGHPFLVYIRFLETALYDICVVVIVNLDVLDEVGFCRMTRDCHDCLGWYFPQIHIGTEGTSCSMISNEHVLWLMAKNLLAATNPVQNGRLVNMGYLATFLNLLDSLGLIHAFRQLSVVLLKNLLDHRMKWNRHFLHGLMGCHGDSILCYLRLG